MALGDPYISNTELKAYLGIGDTADDSLLTSVCKAASQWVEEYSDRQFNKTVTATAKVYRPRDSLTVYVDDFHTTTDLVVKTDTSDDGTYETTWASTDYVLEPFDGVDSGVSGFPYRKLVAVESRTFPCGRRPRVQVTAQWGWTAVPESVLLATQIVAAQMFNLKDSPLGVASFLDNGIIRVRSVPDSAKLLLARYRNPATTGVMVR